MCIQSQADLVGLLRAGRAVRAALEAMEEALEPGVTTGQLDRVAARVLEEHGACSAPERFYGFPGAACISVNDEAVHGVPGSRVIASGDLVTLDVTAELGGYIADAAVTVPVPPVSSEKQKLCDCARAALAKGLVSARAGRSTRAIGRAVEQEVHSWGFAVLRELTGHGVGRAIHEEPTVPNFDDPDARAVLTEGLVLAVEPIISAGSATVRTTDDSWTIVTSDGTLAAHFEQTIIVTRGQPRIVTAA